MHSRKFILITLLASGLFAFGCNNNQLRPPIEPQSDPYGGKQLYVDSRQLQLDTAVGTPLRSRDPGGILHVVVPIRSVIDRQLHVQYRVRFFDRTRHVVSEICGHYPPKEDQVAFSRGVGPQTLAGFIKQIGERNKDKGQQQPDGWVRPTPTPPPPTA